MNEITSTYNLAPRFEGAAHRGETRQAAGRTYGGHGPEPDDAGLGLCRDACHGRDPGNSSQFSPPMLSDTAGLPTSPLPHSRSFAAHMPIKTKLFVLVLSPRPCVF